MAPKKKAAKKTEEVKTEEPKKEEPKAEAPKKEEPKEEPKKEEAKVEAKEEAKDEAKEEPKEEAKADVEMKEPEAPKELEVDVVADTRPKLAAGTVQFSMVDSTLNVLPTAGGKLFMALADDGLQYFLACTRANTGVKSGRYMFEFKILEHVVSMDQGRTKLNGNKQIVRVGLSTSASSLFLSENAESISFDNEGFVTSEKKRTKPQNGLRFVKGQTVGLLLNLDGASPNADTVSLFINGKRASDPIKLPEGLKGKALFPTVNYRGVTLQINLGPTPAEPLPFTCRMLADAAKADTEASSIVEPAQGEVMFPVGLPGQGTFGWVDAFVDKNPGYYELSDRKIVEWATKSGVQQPKIEDFSVSKLMQAVAAMLKRNYIYMDLKSNLLSAEREKSLSKFAGFKKVASVVMGEPDAEYKEKVKAVLLEKKTKEKEKELQRKKAEAERKRLAAEKVKKAEAAKKARLAAQKKNGDEEKEEEKEQEEEKPAEEEDIVMDPVELSEEDLKIVHLPLAMPEISAQALAKAFTKFSIPEKSEGFDAINYPWLPEAECAAHLREYVLERKLTERVDDLQPGEWFKSQWKEYQSLLAAWKKRQQDWKNPAQKKALLAKIAADKKAAKKAEDGEAEEKKEDEEPEKPMEVDAEDLNPLEVEDVMDIGSGEPLFANFGYEDWALLSLRIELHLLVHSFKKDMNDPERTGFHESHAGFYFSKYAKKPLDIKMYGQSSMASLVKLVSEVVSINAQGIFEALLPEDTALSNQFVQLAEEHRRDRQRRVDAGDETAELKFAKPSPSQPQSRPPSQQAPKRPYAPAQQTWQANKQPKIGGYQPVGGYYRR